MASIVLFHSAYGLRPAVHTAAERLRHLGHEVLVPDLYDGQVVDTLDEGLRIRDEIGMPELLSRAASASAPWVDRGLVYSGFSLGAFMAGASPWRMRGPGRCCSSMAPRTSPKKPPPTSRCNCISPTPTPLSRTTG